MQMFLRMEHTISENNFKKMTQTESCRICLKHGDISIFNKNNPLDFPISHYLKLICNIDVRLHDKFPQYLCKYCSNILDSAIKLRKTALKSQLQLKLLNLHQFNMKNISLGDEIKNKHKTISKKQKDLTEFNNMELNHGNTQISSIFDKEARNIENTDLLEDNCVSPIHDDESKETKKQEQNTEDVSNLLTLSINKHNTDKPFEKYYKKVLTPENRPQYQCTLCKKFYKKGSMSDHILTHLPDSISKYVCEVCGKTFKKFCVFYQHRIVHRNTLPFECKVCPYKGRSKTLLQVHIKRVHEKEYKYQCTLCPRKFLDTNNLRYHLRRHSDPKFQCSTCHKLFYENGLLKKHIQSQHMDTVPHKCDVCGNFYKNRKNLLVHQIKVHKRKQVYNNRAIYLKLSQNECTNEIKS